MHIGPPNGDPPPFTYQTREAVFKYGGTRAGNFLRLSLVVMRRRGVIRLMILVLWGFRCPEALEGNGMVLADEDMVSEGGG